MSIYLARFTLTPSTWATLIDKPEDRRQALEPVIAALGGKLHGFWYAFGDADGYVLAEFPATSWRRARSPRWPHAARSRRCPPRSCSPSRRC